MNILFRLFVRDWLVDLFSDSGRAHRRAVRQLSSFLATLMGACMALVFMWPRLSDAAQRNQYLQSITWCIGAIDAELHGRLLDYFMGKYPVPVAPAPVTVPAVVDQAPNFAVDTLPWLLMFVGAWLLAAILLPRAWKRLRGGY